VIEQAAKRAGISYEVVHKIGDHPWEEIIKTATEKGCDVIFMASHGRRGIAALVIGSETNKVLTQPKFPCWCIVDATGVSFWERAGVFIALPLRAGGADRPAAALVAPEASQSVTSRIDRRTRGRNPKRVRMRD
jgi:hypothetical protein